jgi:hypothetical protein
MKRAYVFWNAGICRVLSYPDQEPIASSKHFRRATRAARNQGWNVRVYKGDYAKAPRDAIEVTPGSYVLPAQASK